MFAYKHLLNILLKR